MTEKVVILLGHDGPEKIPRSECYINADIRESSHNYYAGTEIKSRIPG